MAAMGMTSDVGMSGGGMSGGGVDIGDVRRFNAMVTVVRAVGVHRKIAESLSEELRMVYGFAT